MSGGGKLKKILVTGAAGFIGYHVARALLRRGDQVVGVDNFNPYYDPALKRARVARLVSEKGFRLVEADISDRSAMEKLFQEEFPYVIHLAAQAGVRYSLERPELYTASNVTGTLNVLEGCRRVKTSHLVFASSSSVYGLNQRMPFSVHHGADHPASLYAATKKSGELMAHSYSHLFGLPITCLRFFTVYGPWGRPDMAPFLFAKAILDGQPIKMFNQGKMKRDFTYVDDIVRGVIAVADRTPKPGREWNPECPDPASSSAPWKLYNIGNSEPVELERFVAALEQSIGKAARKEYLPLQPGDVVNTFADVADLERDVGFRPATSVEDGVARFVEWYRDYYRC